MSKLRRKFIAVLAVLFCALLTLSAASIIPKKEKTAEAAATTTLKNDIVNETTHLVNDSGLKELFTALSGSATYSAVEDLFKVQNEYTAEALTRQNGGTEYNVLFGGEKWIPAYLSKSGNDIILTLWAVAPANPSNPSAPAESSLVNWAKRDADTAVSRSYSVAYPSSMYSTSYIRAYLNGKDGSGNPLKYSNTDSSLKSISTDYSKYWVEFIDNYSQYITTPLQVSWQGTESATAFDPVSINGNPDDSDTYCRPNEAWGDNPTKANWKTDTSVTPQKTVDNFLYANSYYKNWASDKLWLASLVEAGTGGLWKLSSNQQGGSDYTGLRTGGPASGNNVYYLDESGLCKNYESNRTTSGYRVRPAFHLNLTKLMELAPTDITTTYTGSALTIPDIYSADKSEAPWYNTTVYPNNVGYTYTLDGSASSVLTVGTYKATLKFNNNTMGYIWKNPNANDKNSTTINITVKPKPVKVKFNYQPTVTSGVEAQYPTVTYESDQIVADDDEGGDRYSTHYPTLKIRYINADSSTKSYNSTEKPTLPGNYIAIAEIDSEKVQTLNYELITEGGADRINFTVKPIEVENPTLTNTGNLTYNGKKQTIEIQTNDGLSGGLVKYTVKRDGVDVTADSDITNNSFTVKDAGTYTVTFSFVTEDDIKATHVWKTSKTNDDYVMPTFKVAQAPLTLKLVGSESNPSSVKFDEGVWGAKIAVMFTIDISGVVEGETVKLYVYFTDKDGGGITGLGGTDNTYTIPDNLEKGDYILYVTLDSPSSHAANANYVIKFEDKTQLEKSFTITIANAEFKESNLVWQISNEIDGTKDIASGGSVKYNGKEFTVSLKTSFEELKKLGVKVDKSYGADGFEGALKREYANGVNGAESVYIVTVKIIAYSEDFKFEAKTYEFKWYIAKADYDLSNITIKWGYNARGNTHEYTSGAQYEGGAEVAEGTIEMVVLEGLPAGLTPSLQGNKYSAVGKYTVKITDLTNNDLNYNNIDSVGGYDWASKEWEIIPRTLSTARWDAGEYEGGKMTVAPSVITSPYNPNLKYRYYNTPQCDGEELEFKDLTYSEGKTETYYAQVYIADEDSGNWILGNQCLTYEFTIGKAKTAVTISVTAGGTYDGTQKPAIVALEGTYEGIDVNAFEITYYKVGDDTPLDGAPVDAGSYSVVIALKSNFTEKFYIKDNKPYTFEIKTLVLDIPEYEGTLTYNGEEQDVAKLIGLSDGWENYITISIKSKTSGVDHPTGYSVKLAADYTVTITIRNDVNHGTTINVEWIDKDKMPKILNISVEKLILHALGWVDEEYDSYIVFEENDGRLFVTYTVTNVDGEVVDRATVQASKGETFIVEVDVAEEHRGNVEIVFGSVPKEFDFFTDGGVPPVQVALPTIGDLTFNGENQTFVVDYGEFEEYIEIDRTQGNSLTQYDAGEYTIYFKIKNGKTAVWEAGGRAAVPVTFTMHALVIDEPTIKDTKITYSGKSQNAPLSIDVAALAKYLEIKGDYSAINAGKYDFTVSILADYAGNVVWASADNNTAEKALSWNIEKAKISVKWTDSEVPELDLPEEFNDVDVEYVFTDENGKKVSKDELEPGKKYTVTATLSDGSSANYEFVDESGKALKTSTTEGHGFEIKNKNSLFPWWIIALIAGVLLLLAVLIVVIVKRRQTADGEDEFDDYYDDEYDFDEDIEEDFDDDFGEEY